MTKSTHLALLMDLFLVIEAFVYSSILKNNVKQWLTYITQFIPILYIKKQCHQRNGEVRHLSRPPNELFLWFLIGNIQQRQKLSFSVESKAEKITNGSYINLFVQITWQTLSCTSAFSFIKRSFHIHFSNLT